MCTAKIRVFTACLLIFAFLASGCVTFQRAQRADQLEAELVELRQLAGEKDAHIERLQELLRRQERELREKTLALERLEKELSALKQKGQPVLK